MNLNPAAGVALLVASLAATAGCGESPAAPTLPRCSLSAATELTLAVGADTAIDLTADSGCVSFPLNGSASQVEYLAGRPMP